MNLCLYSQDRTILYCVLFLKTLLDKQYRRLYVSALRVVVTQSLGCDCRQRMLMHIQIYTEVDKGPTGLDSNRRTLPSFVWQLRPIAHPRGQ